MATLDPRDEFNPYLPPKADLARDDAGREKTKGIDLAVENPFFTIWTRPRATIRAIIETDSTYLVLPLAIAEGIVQALDRAALGSVGETQPLADIVIKSLVIGAISGVVGLYIGGALLGWTGRMLGGHAKSPEIRAALAWGQTPALARIPIWILQIGLVGRQMFTTKTPVLVANPGLSLIILATRLVEIVLGIWCFVTVLKCLGEVHEFSAWRALGSILLLVLVFLVPLLLIVGLVMFAAR
jgi:hypothetical protein